MSNAATAMRADRRVPAQVFRRVLDFSATLSTGFRYIRDHRGTLYRPLFFICLPVQVVASVLLGSLFHDFRPGSLFGTTSWWNMFGGYALLGLAYIVGCAVTCEYMRWTIVRPGLAPSLVEVWRETRRNILLYLLLSLITGAMSVLGVFLFFLPFVFLVVTFQFCYPLHAFERAGLGQSIGRAFNLVWGRWWMTFGLLVVLMTMWYFLYLTISIPGALITGFGSLSGIEDLDDAQSRNQRLQWFFTLFSLIANAGALLLLPFTQVPMCFHMLSTLEKKEAPGLMAEIDGFTIDTKAP